MHRFAFLAALMAVTACGQNADPAATAAAACDGADGVVASNAWVREAGEGRSMTAAYVTLCNGGPDDRLVSASFDGAGSVELHESVTGDNGVVSMVPLDGGLALPKGGEASLAPGGAHIMLMGLTAPLESGDEATLTLQFEHAAPLTLSFEVRSPTEAASHEGH